MILSRCSHLVTTTTKYTTRRRCLASLLRRCNSSSSSSVTSFTWMEGRERQVELSFLTRRQDDGTADANVENNSNRKHSNDNDHETMIAQLTLNRPKAANAVGRTMVDHMNECLNHMEWTSLELARCVVVTSSSPKVFSAGADLKERQDMTQEEAEAFVDELRDMMQRLATLPIPVLAAIEGVAVGGGLELALAADIRIASSEASMGFPETSLAIIPGAGGTQRLPRLIGETKAKEWIWTGDRISGDEAYRWGLVNQVVPPGDALSKTLELAWKIASNGPLAIQASKDAILYGMAKSTMKEALQVEKECYGRTLPTFDRLEGLKAFQEGRSPVYKGY